MWMIKRRDEDVVMLNNQLLAECFTLGCFRVIGDDPCRVPFCAREFRLGSILGHDDCGFNVEQTPRQSNRLGMITGGVCDHTFTSIGLT